MYKNKNNNKTFNTCVTVTADECGGNAEKMVRRFTKKVKKEGIIEECRERSHFVKPTVKRAEKKRNRNRVIEKVNRKRNELFSLKSPHKRRR
jgi:ribosomal protein S21